MGFSLPLGVVSCLNCTRQDSCGAFQSPIRGSKSSDGEELGCVDEFQSPIRGSKQIAKVLNSLWGFGFSLPLGVVSFLLKSKAGGTCAFQSPIRGSKIV